MNLPHTASESVFIWHTEGGVINKPVSLCVSSLHVNACVHTACVPNTETRVRLR